MQVSVPMRQSPRAIKAMPGNEQTIPGSRRALLRRRFLGGASVQGEAGPWLRRRSPFFTAHPTVLPAPLGSSEAWWPSRALPAPRPCFGVSVPSQKLGLSFPFPCRAALPVMSQDPGSVPLPPSSPGPFLCSFYSWLDRPLPLSFPGKGCLAGQGVGGPEPRRKPGGKPPAPPRAHQRDGRAPGASVVFRNLTFKVSQQCRLTPTVGVGDDFPLPPLISTDPRGGEGGGAEVSFPEATFPEGAAQLEGAALCSSV